MDFIKELLNGLTIEQIQEKLDTVWGDIKCLDVYKLFFDLFDKLGSIKPFVFLALAVVILLFGQKLMGVFKVIGSFAIGSALGIEVLYPIIKSVGVPNWIVALVCGIIGLVLYRVIYLAAVAFVAGYGIYDVLIVGMIPFLDGLKGNKIIAAAGAAVAIVLVLIFRKFFERAASSVRGANIIVNQIPVIWTGYAAFAGDNASLYQWIAMGVIAFIGLLVQIKTRKRY